jgi:hypothetical protein
MMKERQDSDGISFRIHSIENYERRFADPRFVDANLLEIPA